MLIQAEEKILTGAQVVIESLKAHKVDTIFGYPGGVVLELYDELYKQKEIKHILVRHEQAAVHAAEGYARVSGKCGVVLVTSGPGATNTVTGIANAYMDGYPLVVITGQVFKELIGKEAFQEANICEMVKSCTKNVFQITEAKDIQSVFDKAFESAMSGKKGPVVIDMAKNVFTDSVQYKNINKKSVKSEFIHDFNLENIISIIKNAQKPVIVAGGGVVHSNSYDELYNFSKKYSIPVVSTMMGLGVYPQDDKNFFGMVGIFGDKSANEILKEADLILSLGARFNDRITCMFTDSDLDSKIIQVDINSEEIGRFISPIESAVCDIKQFISTISLKNQNWSSWLTLAQSYKKMNVIRQKTSNMVHSFEVIQKINEYTKNKDVIFTSEVGQHQLWAVQNLSINRDRKILLSGGSGTMGFGFPAAIGACVAEPNKTAICITGDGSIQMSIGELATCSDYNLNLKIIILNNGYLGMVRQLQQKNCEGRYSQTKISNPDFVKLAQSYGIAGIKVNSIADIDSALDKAFEHVGPFVLEIVIEPLEVL